MLTMKWRVIVARTLILVMAGNPVIFAAHGMERTANEHLDRQVTEQREMVRMRQQLAAAQVRAAQTAAQATAPTSTGVSLANGQQAGIKTSANGTTVVDIAAPSQRGVSHNRFNHFNVPAQGLILNNSKDPLISVLGGWTDGNRRLTGGTAGLILAEVTGGTRSSLLGYTEVLGDAAEFVLANPNGITCNGCGFINTPRVVLATGIPDLLNGELIGINISGGDVRIEGAGLNASNVSKFDILTRAIQLNAALYADELNIRTGSNYYDFSTGQVQANAEQAAGSSAYQFALDASALGAMYANSISLIGTEKGLGVRSDGLINSVDSLQLSADGKLQLKDTVAGGNLALHSQQADIVTSGTTYGQNVNIELAGTLHNSGVIAAADTMQVVASGMQQSGDLIAGVNLQGEWQQSATQQLTVSGELVNQGRIISQGQQTLAAAQLQNAAGALLQGGVANISTQSLNNQGVINSASLTLDANTAQSSGHIQAQQLNINARQFNLLDGVVYQSGTDGSFNFSGENLLLASGLLAADGATKVIASGEIRNNTNWLSAGNADISATDIINSGTLQLLAGSDVTADTLNNTGNMLFAGEQAAALNINNTLNNQAGLLQFSSDATLSGANINNDAGQIYHLGQGNISLQAAGQLTNRGGQILSNGNMALAAPQVENQQGTLSAEQLQLSASSINSQAGNIQATALDVTTQQLNNQQGSIAALGESGQSLQLKITDTLDNSQGFILAKGQQLSLSTKQLINDQGSLLLSGADGLTITASGQLRNQQGLIHSGGSLRVNTPLLNNEQGEISATDINVAATTLNNQQGVIGAQQVTLEGAYLNNSAGNIGAFSAAGHNLTLNFSQAIDNSAQGIIQSAADVAVITSRQLNNTDGNIVLAGSKGSLQVRATTLQNQRGQIQTNGQLLLIADNVQNQAGYIAALGDVSINATSVNNSAGQILADKLLLSTEQLTNTDGIILVQNELNLHSPLLANLRGIISAQTLNISGNTLDNTRGQLLAAAELNINTGQLTNLDGVINSQQTLQLSATELNNRSGVIQGVNSFSAQVQGSTDNHSGQLLAGDNLQLHTGLLNNAQGTVAAGGQLNIHTTELQNTAAGVISARELNITAATLLNDTQARIEGQQLQLTTQSLTNAGTLLAAGQQGDSLVLNTDVLNNQGRIESHGENLSLTNLQLNNQQGQIYHLGTGVLSIEALDQLQNQAGQLITAGRLVLQSDTLLNNAGVIESADSINLNHRVLNNDAGSILAAGIQGSSIASEELSNNSGIIAVDSELLNMTATTLANESGYIFANGVLTVDAKTLENQQGEMFAGRLVLRADEVNNTGGTLLANREYGESFDINISGTLHNESGQLLGAGQSARISTNTLNNDTGVIALAGTDVLTIVGNNVNNNTGQISAGGQLALQAHVLQSAGQIGAADINLQVDQLNNSGQLSAEQSIQIVAQQIDNSGQLAARQLTISADNAVNSGTMLASAATGESMLLNLQQLRNSGTIVTNGTALRLNPIKFNNDGGTLLHTGSGVLSIETLDILDNLAGAIITNGDLQLVAEQLNNDQGLLQIAGTASIDVSALHNLSGDILALGSEKLMLTVQQLLDNSAGRIIGGQLEINSANLLNQAGQLAAVNGSGQALAVHISDTLDNTSGQILSTGQAALISSNRLINANGQILQAGDGSLLLQANVIDNNTGGQISSSGMLQLNASQVTNTAEIVSVGHLDIHTDRLTNSGLIQADSLNVSAQELSNRHGQLLALGNNGLALDVASTLDNRAGYIAANSQQMVINAAEILNQGGNIQARHALTIEAQQLNNQQGLINAADATLTLGELDNTTQGQLLVAGQLDLVSHEVNNDGIISATTLTADIAKLTNQADGQLTAEILQLSGGDLQNSGLIYADNLQLQAEQLHNSGLLQVLQQGNINVVTLLNQQGSMLSGDILAIQSQQLSNSGGLLQGGQIQLDSRQLLNDGGQILALGEQGLTMNVSEQLDNLDGIIYSGGEHSVVNATMLNNSGLISHSGTGNLQLQGEALHNSGQIESAGRLQLTTTTLNNTGELSADNLSIQGSSLSNSGTVSANELLVQADTLLNQGELSAAQVQLQLQQLDNSGLVLASGEGQQSLQLAAEHVRNQGIIASQGTELNLQLSTLDNSNGQLLHFGVGVLSIDTLQALTNQQGQIYSAGNLALQADSLDNRSGELQAQAISLSSTHLDNRGGQVLALAQQGNSLTVQVNNVLDNRAGTLYSAGGEATVTADSLLNAAGSVVQAGSGRLTLSTAMIANGADGVIASNDALWLEAGQLESAGQLSAQELHIQADTLVNSGAIEAANLQLGATNTNNSGLIAAQQQLVLNGTALTNSGTIFSEGNLTLTSDQVTNAGTVAQSGIGVLHLDVLDSLNNQSGQIISEGALLLAANSVNNNQGLIQTEQGASIGAANLLNQNGKILGIGAPELAINVQQTLDNTSGVIGATDMVLSAGNLINNAGLVQAEQANILVTALNNNNGRLFSDQLQIQAANLSNNAGLIVANDSLLLQVEQALDNSQGELVITDGNASITAGTLNNDDGIISQLAGQSLQLNSSVITNNGGTLHSAQQLNINAAQLDNSGLVDAATLIVVTDSLTNSGTIQAENARLSSTQLVNEGLLLATGTVGESLQLDVANGIVNRGHIQSHGQNLMLRDVLDNDGGTLVHAGSGELQLAQLSNQQGTVYAGNALTIAGKVLNREGVLQAQGAVNISGAELDNNGGVIRNGGNLLLDITALDNRNGELSSQGATAELKVAGSILNAGGIIVSTGQQLDVQAAELLQGDGVIAGHGLVNIAAGQLSLSEGGQISAGQALELSADTLSNLGLLSGQNVLVQASVLDNQSGVIEAANRLQVAAGYINNTAGTLVSQGELSLDLQGQQDGIALNNNNGQIIATGALTLVTPFAVNNTAGQLLSEQQLQVQAGVLNNSSGEILAGSGLTVNLDTVLDNSGGVLYTRQGDMTLIAQSLLNDADGLILQHGTGQMQLTLNALNNNGEIGAGTVLAVTAQQLTNSGLIQASTVELAAEQLRNSGNLLGDNLFISANQLNNTDGTIAALATDSMLQINAAELNNQRGLIQSRGNAMQLNTVLNNQQGDVVLLGNGTLNISALANNQQGRILSEGAVALAGVVNNNQGVVQAATDLQLAGTDISNIAGVMHAGGALNISGNSLINQGGKISAAGQSYQLAISGAIDNSLDGILTTTGNMQITAASLSNTSGLIYQQGDGSLLLQVDNTLNNNDGTIAATDLAITADRLNNNTGLIQGGAVDISTALLNNNAGTIYQQGSAGKLNISSGSLTNDAGQISALADASISAGQLSNNAGRIESGSALHLSGGALNNDSGNLVANNITMQLTGGLSNNQGTLFAADTLTITADSIDNALGTLAANADIQLTVATGLTNNQGLLQAAGNLVASAQQIDNSAGTIQATAAQLNAQQSINNTAGVINAQTLALSTATLDNSYGVILATDTNDNSLQLTDITQLNNSNGTLASHGRNWDFTLAGLNNDNGKLLHLGSGTFTLSQAGNLANTGTIASNANLVINAGNVSNSGTLQAQQQLQLNSALANQTGAVLVANNITVNAAGNTITNAGSISAANNLQLDAVSLNNSHLLYAGNNALVKAANVSNSGTWSANNLNVSGFNLLQNSGRIESNTASYTGNTLQNQGSGVLINAATAANSLQLNVAQLTNSGTLYNNARDMSFGGNLSNSGSIIHAGTGNLLLGNNGTINNAGGSIASAGLATIQNSILGAGTVYAEQGMLINGSGTFTNNSQLYTKGNMQVNSALHNQGGSLLSDGNLTINTAGSVTNTGSLQGQNLSLTAGALNNNGGTITSTGTNNAQISAASLSNNGGVIQATNNNFSLITRSGELNNSNGQIKHGGNGLLTLQSASHLNQQSGLVQSAGQLVVTAQGNLDNSYGVLSASQYQLTSSGTLTNNNGQIIATSSGTGSGSSSIQSGTLLNRNGHIAANGTNLTLNTAALDNNNGSILLAGSGNLAITASSVANDAANSRIISNGGISLNSGSALNNAGVISAANLFTLTGTNITNSGTLASRSGKVDIDSSGTLTNSGTISGATAVELDVRTLNNAGGTVQSDGTVAIAVNSLSAGQIYGRDLLLSSTNNITLQNGEQLSASRNLQLNSNGNITNSGNIVASGTLNVDATDLTNNATGVIRSGGNAVLDLNRLTNSGIVSSNAVLTLNAANTTNTGTIAAGSHLDINGNIDNRNLLFAGSLLTIDGNVSNTANIYSNQDAFISGATVTNTGGTIAAARDMSISGNILNTHSGERSFIEGEKITTRKVIKNETYYGIPGLTPGTTENMTEVVTEERTVTTFGINISGKLGVIAAGNNLGLNGNIVNEYSTISAGQDLVVSGNDFSSGSMQNQNVVEVKHIRVSTFEVCILGSCERDPNAESKVIKEETEIEYTGGAFGTVVAGGDISGNLSGKVEQSNLSPISTSGSNVNTNANGSSGSASRGNNAGASNSSTVAVNRNNGTSQNTSGANRSANGVTAGNSGTVDAEWRDSNVNHTGVQPGSQPDNVGIGQVVGTTARQINTLDAAGQTVANNTALQSQQQQVGQVGSATLQSKQQAGSGSGVSTGEALPAQQVHNTAVALLQLDKLSGQSTEPLSHSEQGPEVAQQQGNNFNSTGPVAGIPQTAQQQAGVTVVGINQTAKASADKATDPALGTDIADGVWQINPQDGGTAVSGDNRQLNAGDLLHGNDLNVGSAQLVATQGNVRNVQVTDPARQQADAMQSGIAAQGIGFMSPDMAASLRVSQGTAPQGPGQQQGGGLVGNGNIAGNGDYNPDLIIKGLVDNQQGTLAQQKNSAQQSSAQQQSATQTAIQGNSATGQQAGKNVFITDEQMRVLTEDLGFDANAINKGQQALYAAISQNDLLADGVTLSAGGTIDITADAGFNIDSGIAAGEGLILRSEGGLNMGNFGFLDSENLLGLQLGGDFTNNMNLQSDTLWLDIGGDFTNLGSLTGNDVLSISAGNDLINQNLLSGGHVLLNAGGDIINRTEFSQHTVNFDNGNSSTYTSVGKAPQIISNDSLSMTAGNNIDLQGSKFSAAGDISLNAGNDVLLGAVEKLSGHEKYFKGGHDIELHRTYDVVSFDAGGNLSVVAGNNLQSEGALFAAAGDVELAAGNEMNLLGVVEYHEDLDKRTKKSTFKKTVYIDETYSAEHQGSVIVAGGNVSLNAQQGDDGLQLLNSGNVLLEGTYIQAGGNMVAYSGGELNIVSGEEWQAENHVKKKSMFGGLFGSTSISETDVQYLGHAELNAGGDMVLLAQNDINVLAGRINADNIVAQAGFGNEGAKAADINILGDTETTSLYQETRRNGLALGFSDNFLSVAKETANENRTIQTDYVGSVFTAKDNMALTASRDVNIVGSELHAGGNLLLDAGRDINVLTGQGSNSSYSRQTETKTGIAISADSNTLSVFAGDDTQKDALTSNSTTQTGSVLTANNVQLNAGNDLLISGSDIAAVNDIRLSAVKDISIVTAQELFNQQTEHSSIRDGLTVSANYNIGNTVDAISNLGQGGDAVSVASSVMQAADTLNNAGPSAGAHLGQTTTTTTNTVQQGIAKGSSLTAGGNVTVNAGGDALFEGVQVNAIGNINVDAENISVLAAQNSSGSQHNTEYLQVGLNLNASTSNVSLTAGFSQSDSELDTQNTDAMGSGLNAGGNVNVNARNDLAIIGSDINGDDSVALTAGNDIIIKAAENQFSSNSEDSHLSAGAGANFGSNGVGFTANMAMGEGELDREGTNHSNSHITAGNNLTVKSGNDTTIAGGNLAATDVDMDIGGNLTVASVQNTSQVEGDRWDVSANITVGAGASGGASVGYGETEGSSAWVNEQSSIIGSGSVNIRTEGHTQIDGAVIANIDENGNDLGNLTLDTGSLAYTDIADHDKEKSYYLNVGFTIGDDTSTNQKESNTNYNASGNYSNHDKEQINRATVGEGNIIVRDNPQQDLGDLNRDTSIAQEITKDDSKDVNLYASTTALESLGNLVESPEKRDEQLNKWRNNVASIGSPEAYMGLLNASLDALEQTPGAINDAIAAVSYFIENLGGLSPKELIAFDETVKNNPELLQRLQNSDSAAERELAEKMLAGIAQIEDGTLVNQGQLPEDNHQIADAPPMPEKSAETQQQEFEAAQNRLNDQFAAGQQSSTDAFENGNIAGWVDSWGSGGNGLIGLNADYESYMGHRQNEIDTFNQFKSELSGPGAFGFYGGANLFEGMINFGESLAGMTRYTGIQGSGTAADAWSDLGTGLQNAGSYAYHDPSGFAYAVAVDPFVNSYDRYTTIYNNDGLGAALGTAATDGLLNMLERPSLGINIPAVKGKGGSGSDSNSGSSSPKGPTTELESNIVYGSVSEANFAQTSIRSDRTFSPDGQRIYSELVGYPINTVDDLSSALKKGDISPADVPVDFVDMNGTRLILNTRTSTALQDAGIPKSQWYGTQRTGQTAYIDDFGKPVTYNDLAINQLDNNKLPPTGSPTLPSGE
ncbi:hemagglutinin repeat-containing protein [Rheinheimera hassiensis]|uniref:hemagglutinin repeat-containing protein n=1 Tax=Rheinheimera hassiensis TaxID=1193627 RepID=UPI001F052278|nr:hemagglutinin repeat-containing protein [Rheinheimera hassiensis]